jgi:nicotinic acid phosphoribosyltransferase
MGGGITHEGSRDAFSFSMKATAYSIDGVNWTRLLKEPKTDISKKSLSGLVRCVEDETGNLKVVDCTATPEHFFVEGPGHRRWLYNGVKTFSQDFDDVKARASAGII